MIHTAITNHIRHIHKIFITIVKILISRTSGGNIKLLCLFSVILLISNKLILSALRQTNKLEAAIGAEPIHGGSISNPTLQKASLEIGILSWQINCIWNI